jgi:hypothetical protein
MKFVLSDDQGNNIAAGETKSGEVATGTQTFTGAAAVPTFGSGSVSGGGTTIRSWWSSTAYVPFSENHPYYNASYVVAFNLYDDKDNLVLSPKTKEVTLRIITSTGEEDVVYPLGK